MENVNIVMICDNNYVIPTAVAITSIIYNCKFTKKIVFYILCDNLRSEYIDLFYSFNNDDIKIIIKKVDSTAYKGLEKNIVLFLRLLY